MSGFLGLDKNRRLKARVGRAPENEADLNGFDPDPFEKYSSNWISSPGRVENKKRLKLANVDPSKIPMFN